MTTMINPESTGLILNLIARYSEGKSENKYDRAVKDALEGDPASKQSVKKIVEALKTKPAVIRLLPKEMTINPAHTLAEEKFTTAFKKFQLLPQNKLLNDDAPNVKFSGGNGTATNIRLFYRGIKCLEETSESSASDEPYLITSVVDSDLKVKTVRNPYTQTSYTDVDAGEKRVGPEVAIYNGKAKDLTLIAVMMEYDYGNPEEFKQTIDLIVKASAAAVKAGTGITIPQAITDILTDIINALFGTEDDLIETDTRLIEKSQLITWSKAALKTKEKETLFGKEIEMPAPMGYHFRTWHVGDGGRYRAYYCVRPEEN